MRRSRTWLAAGLLGVLLLGADAVYRAGPRHRSDLPVYLAGARAVLRGEDPVEVVSPERGWRYYYPPTLATLLVPMATWPLQVAAAAWFAASAAALAGGALAARRALEREAPWDRRDAAGLLLAALPAGSALLRGQLGPLLLGLAGGALLALARRREARAGALVGLAAAIKLVPGLLLAGLLLGRRWRAAAAALVVAAAATLLLPAPFLGLEGAARSTAHSLEILVVRTAEDPDHLRPGEVDLDPHIDRNQSLSSQVVRRTVAGPARTLLLGALGLVVLGAALAPALRRADPAGPESLALWLAAPLLLAPVAWHHHHVLLAPVGLALGARGRRGERGADLALAAALVLSTLHFAVDPLRGLGLLGWGTLVAVVGLAAVAVEPSVQETAAPTSP